MNEIKLNNEYHIPTPIRISPFYPERIFTVYSNGQAYKIVVEQNTDVPVFKNDKALLEAKSFSSAYDAIYYILYHYCTFSSTNTIVFDYGIDYEKMVIIRYATVNGAVQAGGKITYIYTQTVISIPTGVTWSKTTDPDILFHTLCDDIIYHLDNNVNNNASNTSYPHTDTLQEK